jgi:PAS domain S-box-containing protein
MAETAAAPAPITKRPHLSIPPIAALLAVGFGYFTGSYGSHLLALETDQVAFFWPSGAILLAALLLGRREQWPVYSAVALVCGMAADLLSAEFGAPTLVTPLNVLEVVGVAVLLRQWDPDGPSFTTLGGIVKFIGAVACGAAFTAIVGAAAVDQLAGADFLSRWLTWFAADALGVLLVTPLIVTLLNFREGRQELPSRLKLEGVWLFGAVTLISIIVFSTDTAPLAFAAMPFVLLATLRLGALGATVSTLIVTAVAVTMTAFGHGPLNLVSGGLIARVQYLQLYLAVIFVATLPLSGILSEREKLVARIKESDDAYRSMVGTVSDVIYQTSPEGHWTFLNGAWEDLTGFSRDETIGRNFLSSVYGPDRAGLLAAITDATMRNLDQVNREVRFIDANGRTRWSELRARVLRDRSGKLTGSAGTLTDITQRKQEEGRRLAEEARYRAIFDHAVDAILIIDDLGRVRSLNPATERMFNSTWSSMEMADLRELIRWEGDDQSGLDFDRSLLAAKEGEGLCANGRSFPIELSVSEWRADNARYFTAILRDITARREAEQALTESESRYRLLAQNISDAILLLKVDGTCLYASPSAIELAGRPAEELIGRYVTDFVDEEDRERVREVHVQVVMAPGSSGTVSYRYHHPDGRLLWLETNTRSVADESGKVVEVISAIRDISQRKALEDELVAARDVAEAAAQAKSSFLANMSHEIRTPMNGVLGFAEVLAKADLSPEQHRYAEAIVTSGRSLMRLLNDILDMSKIEAGALEVAIEPFDLPHLLRQCGNMFAPTAEAKNLDLNLVLYGDLPQHVRSDPHRLRQILLNLLGNAIKFTTSGHVELAAYMDGPGMLRVAVADSGIGIPLERQASIFNEFEQEDASTSRRYGGTGLGLSISRKLAGLLGGTLELASEPGVGTTVTLVIPVEVTDGAPIKASGASAPRDPAARPAHILLAEDVEINRELVKTLLTAAGHTLDAVENGAKAIAAVEAGNYDLVLMDVQMPEVDGLEATRAIRAMGGKYAKLPIIALTANAFRAEIDACLDAGMNDHVVKPIEEAKLLAAIDAAMSEQEEQPAMADPIPVTRPAPVLPPALREKYFAQCRDSAAALDEAATAGDAKAVVATCHKLSGVSAVFGYAEIGDAARAIEAAVKQDGLSEHNAKLATLLADELRGIADA